MMRSHSFLVASIPALASMIGCSTAPSTTVGKDDIRRDAKIIVGTVRKNDPSLAIIMDKGVGYAVFPTVGKGAAGVGGAYGRGVLYEGGVMSGYCDLSQVTIGFQLGGQSYTEIITFENKDAVDRFKRGEFAFDAQASAVAVQSGAGANAKYNQGVAVFTMAETGLMYEASVGGQKFTYQAN